MRAAMGLVASILVRNECFEYKRCVRDIHTQQKFVTSNRKGAYELAILEGLIYDFKISSTTSLEMARCTTVGIEASRDS